jgi:hypothetical protein
MMNINGALSRQEKSVRVSHTADLLAERPPG